MQLSFAEWLTGFSVAGSPRVASCFLKDFWIPKNHCHVPERLVPGPGVTRIPNCRQLLRDE